MPNSYEPSNISAIDIRQGHEEEDWAKVAKACSDHLTDWGIKTLRQGLDNRVRTVLIEPRYICKDYRNLYSNFYSKKFVDRPSTCERLHFFSKAGLPLGDLLWEAENNQDIYIGYSVIQPVRERCLGRSFFDPLKLGHSHDSFFCLRTHSQVHINGCQFTAWGYPYSSQSREATVCAHAALWGVCRYLSERYPMYAEVYPYDLIEMTGNSGGRRVPYRGMTYTDYSEILTDFGCYPAIIRPKHKPGQQPEWEDQREAYYDIYSYVESGFPVLVSFNQHVATVVGHTLRDSLTALPSDVVEEVPGFVNSFFLTEYFITVDDNYFPYVTLGRRGDKKNYGEKFDANMVPYGVSIDSILAAVVPLPEKTFLPPREARALAYRYFAHDDVRKELRETLNAIGEDEDAKLIARLYMTSSSSFKKRKRACALGTLGQQPDRLAWLTADLNLPHFVWVMEVSPLSSYKDGLAIGEVVLDATASKDESEYVYLRVGKTVLRLTDEESDPLAVDRFPQYTHNLGERDA